MLYAAIVDDEQLARSRLRRLLEKIAGQRIKVVAECVDVGELLAVSGDVHLDILFLDIELPGGNGFTALRRWNGSTPMVVFVTAYDHHGVQAFAENAIDYLLKPVSLDRLRETISRIEDRVHSVRRHAELSGKKLSFDVGRRTVLVDEQQIELVRVKGNYLDIETSNGTYTRRQPLTDFLRELEPESFSRIHRSAAIRSTSIENALAIGSGRYVVTLASGKSVISGRLYCKVVQGLLHKAARRELTQGS